MTEIFYIINVISKITIIIGILLLFILICRRYLDAIYEHVDGLLNDDNLNKLGIPHIHKDRRLYHIIKRIIDLLCSSLFLVINLPLMLFIAILIKAESRGPIFIKQKRLGKRGKVFYAYKFRTMTFFPQEEKLLKEIKLNIKINDDPRITVVGKFLRKTSLDEFPKFLSVLKGDMSLIGTSEATDYSYIEGLGNEAANAILSVKPGLVSLWSLSGSRMRWDLSYRLAYDVYYVSHQSFILDLSILLMTPISVLGRASSA